MIIYARYVYLSHQFVNYAANGRTESPSDFCGVGLLVIGKLGEQSTMYCTYSKGFPNEQIAMNANL